MPRPTLAASVLVAALLVAGCGTPPAPKTDPPRSASGPVSTPSAATTTTVTTAAGSATPTSGTVPVDQIPPGRPARWIPAGMPTVAPWKEPGDVLPTFTLAMFKQDSAGAVATVMYYIQALNWALATLAPKAYLIVCDAESCRSNAQRLEGYRARGEHLVGGRATHQDLGGVGASSAPVARVTIRATAALSAGRLVDHKGSTVKAQGAGDLTLAITLVWSGKMWRISRVSWVPAPR